MTMTIEHNEAPTAQILWASPETDLWVASRSGEYAGMVEFRDGHFVARDSTGGSLGEFSSIPAARDAVNASGTGSPAPRLTATTSRFIRRGGARPERRTRP